MASARATICKAIADGLLADIQGIGEYNTRIFETHVKTVPLDVLNQDSISVTPGPETREYQPSNQVFKYLTVYVRVFVINEEDNPEMALEKYLADVEHWLDSNRQLSLPTDYNNNLPGGLQENTLEIDIESISTDEGLLLPSAVGEITITVTYTNSVLC